MANKNEILKSDYLSGELINDSKNPWKTVLIYAVVGLVWILFSDRVLNFFIKDQEVNLLLQSFKGSFYVLVTAIMLFYLIKVDYSTIMKLAKSISQKNEVLVSYTEELIASEDELKNKIEMLNITMDELTAQKEYVYEIYNSSNTAIMIWSLNGVVNEVNDYFCDLFEIEAEDVIGKKWFDVIIPTGERAFVSKLVSQLRIHHKVKNFEMKVITNQGKLLDVIWNDSLSKILLQMSC